jgi:hypothetical protein
MHIHNQQAVIRDIKFIEHVDTHVDIHASEHCCWNCLWSVMTYNSLWCDKDMDEVDFRDLCVSWDGERRCL